MIINVRPSVYVKANLLVLCKWNLTVTTVVAEDMREELKWGEKARGGRVKEGDKDLFSL